MPKVHVFARDHINTDEIIPARHLTTDVEAELAPYAMEDYDRDFVKRVQPGDIVVAGADFGCGSSREHAVWALRGAGVAAVFTPKDFGITQIIGRIVDEIRRANKLDPQEAPA